MLYWENATIEMLEKFYKYGGFCSICNGDTKQVWFKVEE